MDCRDEVAPSPMIGKRALDFVEIFHGCERRDRAYPAAKPTRATTASAVQGLSWTKPSASRAALRAFLIHDSAVALMGSATPASAPDALEPRPPTCKSRFCTTELGWVVNIADSPQSELNNSRR
jgi:hypothetical protein